MPIFDTCIITASSERQAEVFRGLIARRVERGLYPREIDFRVYADPPAGRIGSGEDFLVSRFEDERLRLVEFSLNKAGL